MSFKKSAKKKKNKKKKKKKLLKAYMHFLKVEKGFLMF